MNKSLFFVLCVVVALDVAMVNALIKVRPYFQIHMLDVGQGDSFLLVTPEQNHILYDGGPGNAVLMELSAVMPYMLDKIDLMVISHPDKDHIEGLAYVLDRFDVGAVLMSAPEHDTLLFKTIIDKLDDLPVYIADDDTDFAFGDTYLDVLYPFEPIFGKAARNSNNTSVVIKVSFGGIKLLLNGDAEKEAESAMIAKGVDLKADILKAGHHGSSSSNTEAFLRAVDPDLFLISAGRDNSYGHPTAEVIERISKLGIDSLNTIDDGRVSLVLDERYAPFWRSILAPRERSFSSRRS